MEVILDSAIEVASQCLEDFPSSVKELCKSCDFNHTSQLLITTEDSTSNIQHATMATHGVWQAMLGCCGNDRILSNKQRYQLGMILDNANKLFDALLFLPHIFLEHVVKELSIIPLEVLCTLHSKHLLSIEDVLQSSSTASQYILTSIIDVERRENQRDVMFKVAEIICDLVLRKCLIAIEMMEHLPTLILNQSSTTSPTTLMRAAVENIAVDDVATQELASIILTSHLTPPITSLYEAVSLQNQWQYSTFTQSKIILYSDILSALNSTKFIELIQKALSIEQLNWQSLLQVMVFFLYNYDNSPNIVQELVKDLIIEGLADSDKHMFSCGILIARQASLEGSHLFPSYQKWLKIMFGDNSSVIEGKKQLLFLLKVLTTFVPYDPIFALKAHINQPPHQIMKCLSQVKDYINLVTTRLNDMGEKVTNVTNNDEDDDDANSDVREAIVYYNEFGHISQKVIEASIFKLPYYRGRFLPCLLSPSYGSHSDRKNFINALTREKRIPQNMLKNYERACHDLTEKSSSMSIMNDEMMCILKELPTLVKEDKSIKKLLSRLSHCLFNSLSQYSIPNMISIIDDIINGVCETVNISTSHKWWLLDVMAILNQHNELHYPFYLRLRELLTNQLLQLSHSQLYGIAVITSTMLCHCHDMNTVIDDIPLKTGKDIIMSILSSMVPSNVVCMRFDGLFIEQLLISDHSIPQYLLQRMMYSYKRQQFIHTTTSCHNGKNEMLKIADTLLIEYHSFVTQWQDCEVRFDDWLCWELTVCSVEDEMSNDLRILYHWREIFENYMHTCSVDYIFLVLFKSLSFSSTDCYNCTFFTIIQELSHMLGENNTNLSTILTKILKEANNKLSSTSAIAKTMMLAICLPPSCMFCGCKDTQTVADFIQHTLTPYSQDILMVLPAHITHYLLLGVSTLPESAVSELCNMSHVFLTSLLIHWQALPEENRPCHFETTATWLHSGMQSMLPSDSVKFGPLAVAIWHYVTQHHHNIMNWLKHTPSEIAVLVSACCVHWLSMNISSSSHLQTNVLSLLQMCIEYCPSSVEAFTVEQQQNIDVKLKHTQILTDFRLAVCWKPSLAFYQLSLLRFLGSLSIPDLQRIVTTAEPCLLWLCVLAHKQCLTFSTPLPLQPPQSFQPLNAEFIQHSTMILHEIIDNTDCYQLQNVMKHCDNQLKSIITAKLNT